MDWEETVEPQEEAESWCAWMRTEHIVQNGSVIMKTTIAYN